MKMFKPENIIIFFSLLLAFIFGLTVDIMEVDAAQYASMSRQMMETGEYLQIYNKSVPYLDKPPLLFWLSAISLEIFGVYDWAYKLPSFLCSLLGLYSVYRLAKLYYGHLAGLLSATVYVSCVAMFLMNNDVRTDTLLTAFTIFSIWNIAAYLVHQRKSNFIAGFIGIGLAMLAKGPIGIMVPVLAIGTHLILQRSWKTIFNPRWITGLLIVSIVLTPMCIGLYQQHGSNGLYFFFWEQSFGRITGENKWSNNAPIYFLLQNFLWLFLPWTILLILALWNNIKQLFQKKFKIQKEEEGIIIGGFILPFIALSLSSYQLPHYIYVVIPMAAILTGKYIRNLLNHGNHRLKILQSVQVGIALLIFLLSGLLLYFFPDILWLWIGLMLISITGIFWIYFRGNEMKKLLYPSLIAVGFFFLYLNAGFYPNLLQYQAPSELGKYYGQHKKSGEALFFYNTSGHALDFYGKTYSKVLAQEESLSELLKNGGFWVYTDKAGLKFIREQNITIDEIKVTDHYNVQFLSMPFLNPATREDRLSKRYLLYIQ